MSRDCPECGTELSEETVDYVTDCYLAENYLDATAVCGECGTPVKIGGKFNVYHRENVS